MSTDKSSKEDETAVQRAVKAMRAKRNSAGFVRKEVIVHRDDIAKLRAFVSKLRRPEPATSNQT